MFAIEAAFAVHLAVESERGACGEPKCGSIERRESAGVCGIERGDERVEWGGGRRERCGAEELVFVLDLDVAFDADDGLPAWWQWRISR